MKQCEKIKQEQKLEHQKWLSNPYLYPKIELNLDDKPILNKEASKEVNKEASKDFAVVDVYIIKQKWRKSHGVSFKNFCFLKQELAEKFINEKRSINNNDKVLYLDIVVKKAITFDDGKSVHILPNSEEIIS